MLPFEGIGLYSSVATFLEAVNCLLCLVALWSAFSQKQKRIVVWLLPLTLTHLAACVGAFLPLLLRMQGHPETVSQALGTGMLTLVLSFLTTICILVYVAQQKS
jgi:hypothetical protein